MLVVHRIESTTFDKLGYIPEAVLGPTVGAGKLSSVLPRRVTDPNR